MGLDPAPTKMVENYHTWTPTPTARKDSLNAISSLPPGAGKVYSFSVQTRAHMTTILPVRLVPTILSKLGLVGNTININSYGVA